MRIEFTDHITQLSSLTQTYIYGGNIGQVLSAGLKGAGSGAIMGAVGGYYGKAWSLSRVGATSIAGGFAAKSAGGSFNQGFKIALATSMVRFAWEGAKSSTDSLKIKTGEYRTDNNGNVLTAGSRGYDPKLQLQSKSIFSGIVMDPEGSGFHMGFPENSLVGQFINDVSKFHDFGNSWGYDWSSGFVNPAMNSVAVESLYDVWSFSSMIPAAALTSVALSASNPGVYVVYDQIR